MRIHFVGVCGVMMAPLAVAMQDAGHSVSGSDKGFYPPISDYLKANHMNILVGYKESHIPDDLDLAVIGAAITPNNPEYLEIVKKGIRHYMGYGQFLHDFVIKKNSIVVAGTYGKTTITAFLAHLLQTAQFDPTYAIGAIPVNSDHGVRLANSEWSVCEGDEYINSRIDFIPRFMFYSPTFLIVNAVKYDHLDVYKTESDYITAYKNLIASMPEGSTVIVNADGEHIQDVVQDFASTRNIVFVGTKKGTSGHTVD